MKTVLFEFRFPKDFTCEIWIDGEMRDAWAEFQPPPKGWKKPASTKTIPARKQSPTDEAWLKIVADINPRTFKGERASAKTAGEFVNKSIETQQGNALDAASLRGVVYAPVNHITEFWTPAYIQKLARALARPRRKKNDLLLKEWLARNWIKSGLKSMTREALTIEANRKLGSSFKEAKVWQTAYRLGLFTDRKPGPPNRKWSSLQT